MDQQTISPKTFWQRPEGKTGTIIGLGILAGGAKEEAIVRMISLKGIFK